MTAVAPSARHRRQGTGKRTGKDTGAARGGSTATSRATTRSSTAILLVAVVAVLNVIGAVMVLSASSVSSLTDYGSPWFFFLRQMLWTGIGLAAFVFAIKFDYHNWQRIVRPLLIVSIILLGAVLLPGVGIYVSGARRWMGYGIFRFQPSEIEGGRPFKLDSNAPSIPVRDFVATETRFAVLERTNPEDRKSVV